MSGALCWLLDHLPLMAEAHESLSGGASIDYESGIISSWAL